MRGWLTKTIFLLSAVSLLNDVAGELLYPVLPLYMASIGYGALWIGILEGCAEATAGLTKGWFGEWSDRSGMRLPFVRAGYFLSAVCKPFLALFSNAGWAFFMRTGDRLGKGIRTGARDAMLADETESSKRGKVFGFHRALDTAGAVIGPLLALIWLDFHRNGNYKALFYYALIPGLLALILLFFISEKRKENKGGIPASPFSNFGYWKKASVEYRKLLIGILAFTLFNSSDMFLLLLVKKVFAQGIDLPSIFGKQIASADMIVVVFYILYNCFYALFSYPAGFLSDKFGPKRMLIFGYICFSLAYGGMGYCAAGNSNNFYFVLMCFVVYGIYAAFTDGVSKAWVSKLCGKDEKGVALGLFSGFTSIATLIASIVAGVVWTFAGPVPVFIIPALVALLTGIYLTFLFRSPTIKKN